MIIPPFLKPGDKIGICCTARFVTPEGLQPCIETLKSWGFEPVLGNYIFEKDFQYGGTDTQRAADFQSFLDNPDIKAIIIAKGGYGTVRMVDLLSFDKFIINPKWVCGYSDVTVLHAHVQSKTGIATLHSPMAMNFPRGLLSQEVLNSFRGFLMGELPEFNFGESSVVQNRVGMSSGKIVGGNLSLLYALAESNSDMDFEGKILFLEDIDEYLYHIDRMMWQLKRSGKLAKLAGLVVGSFSDMKDNLEPFGKDAEVIIAEAVSDYSYPVAFNFPAGHISGNFPLPLGLNVQLTVKEKGSNLIYSV